MTLEDPINWIIHPPHPVRFDLVWHLGLEKKPQKIGEKKPATNTVVLFDILYN